jgi:glycosyltransferase involved in cell wall biosynthesis
VTPVFNQANFVGETVESVLRQDYPNIEYIVIDDGSTDDSWSVVHALAQAHPGRFQLVRQENVGQAETLNRGWARARGEVLAYLSSDDLLHPQAVSQMVAALRDKPDVMVAYCDFRLIDASGQRMAEVRTEDFSLERLRDHLVCQPGPGAFFRRDVFIHAKGWNPALRQVPDFEFWLRAADTGGFLRVPLVLADYRVHDESASFRPMVVERADEIVRVVSAYWSKEKLESVEDARFAQGMSLVISAMNHAQSGRAALAFRRLWAGLRTCPALGLQLIVWRRLVSGFFRRAYYRLGAGS